VFNDRGSNSHTHTRTYTRFQSTCVVTFLTRQKVLSHSPAGPAESILAESAPGNQGVGQGLGWLVMNVPFLSLDSPCLLSEIFNAEVLFREDCTPGKAGSLCVCGWCGVCVHVCVCVVCACGLSPAGKLNFFFVKNSSQLHARWEPNSTFNWRLQTCAVDST